MLPLHLKIKGIDLIAELSVRVHKDGAFGFDCFFKFFSCAHQIPKTLVNQKRAIFLRNPHFNQRCMFFMISDQ